MGKTGGERQRWAFWLKADSTRFWGVLRAARHDKEALCGYRCMGWEAPGQLPKFTQDLQ